jgi:glucokinase
VGYVGAVDLGGTKILAAVFGPDGQVAARAKRSTGRDHTPAAVFERITVCLNEAAAGAGVDLAALQAVGLGAPGPIRPEDGSITIAPNLDWKDVPLRAELAARLPVPVAVGNDVRVAVLAEHAAGAARGVRHLVAVWPGTGVGGGLILDGELYTGSGTMAGEVGHVTLKAGGPKCPCGGRGHLEALVSRTAIVKAIAKKVKRGERTYLTRRAGHDVTRATSGDLAEAWHRGDKLVTRALEEVAYYLGLAIAGLANLLNPELVVLGGGLVEGLQEPFVEMVRQRVATQPLFSSTGPLRIVKSTLGDDAGITGAALLARRLQAARRASPGPSPGAAAPA